MVKENRDTQKKKTGVFPWIRGWACVHAPSVTAWTAWTVASQVPLFLGFPRQKYWSGLLFPSPENLPNPGIEPMSVELHWHVGSLPAEPRGKQAKDIAGNTNFKCLQDCPGEEEAYSFCVASEGEKELVANLKGHRF